MAAGKLVRLAVWLCLKTATLGLGSNHGHGRRFSHRLNAEVTHNTNWVADNVSCLLRCCALCLQDSACFSVFYDRRASRCRAYNYWFFQAEKASLSPGGDYVHFSKNRTCETKNGLTYFQDAHLCVKTFKQKMKWRDANSTCSKHRLHLLLVESQYQHDVIVRYLKNRGLQQQNHYIGANDIDAEGSWVAWNGRQLQFSQWSSGQPNNAYNQDCVQMYASYQLLWVDRPCAERAYFICQQEL